SAGGWIRAHRPGARRPVRAGPRRGPAGGPPDTAPLQPRRSDRGGGRARGRSGPGVRFRARHGARATRATRTEEILMAQSRTTTRSERRMNARADANLSMRLMTAAGSDGQPEFVTESENISASGVYCFSPHYLAPLSKVGLTLVLPDGVVEDPRDRLLK